jgi:hypothetical protein
VLHNNDALIERYQPFVAKVADGSKAISVSPEKVVANLSCLGQLVKSRQRKQDSEVEALHRRYPEASHLEKEIARVYLSPAPRLVFLNCWNMLVSLDALPDRTWKGSQRETLDSTNNAYERAIGWRIKERYRTIPGY